MTKSTSPTSRRSFLQTAGLAAAALGLKDSSLGQEKPIPGFEEAPTDPNASKGWKLFSNRKIRVGIVGYGTCRFGAAFSFQDHPNVKVEAVSDLFPDRCAALARVCQIRVEENLCYRYKPTGWMQCVKTQSS